MKEVEWTMANIQKYKTSQVGGILEHNSRTGETKQHNHSNKDIDPTRTADNYELCSGTGTAYERYKERMGQLHCMQRDDVTVLDSLIVTMPQNVKEGDERAFFEGVYAFACADYGEKNIVNATVHVDETQPHIHIGFIPVINGKLRNGTAVEKVNHSKLITQTYLRAFHPRLSRFIADKLGYEVDILNGATDNGNKTINTLKAERAAREAAQRAVQATQTQIRLEAMQEQEQALQSRTEGLQSEIGTLTQNRDALQEQEQVLQSHTEGFIIDEKNT